MFTLSDIRNIAVQIEENGEATYRRAAERSVDPERKRLFTWMADEERGHAEEFANIRADAPLTPEQAELEAMGRELLQDIVRSQTFSLQGRQLAEADDLEELIAQSIEFEQDTIDFYEFLASFLDDPGAMEQMRRIIDQEREHVRQLEAVRAEGAPPEMGSA